MTRVIVHIDKLVLRGIDSADASAISEGVQAQLQRLIAEPGVATGIADLGNRPRVKTQTVQAAVGDQFGMTIGQQVFEGISNRSPR